MNPNETRTSHPSSAQLETLVEFMKRNPGMAKGFLKTQNARERSRRQWEDLTMRLNSLGGTIKTYKQWIKVKEGYDEYWRFLRLSDCQSTELLSQGARLLEYSLCNLKSYKNISNK